MYVLEYGKIIASTDLMDADSNGYSCSKNKRQAVRVERRISETNSAARVLSLIIRAGRKYMTDEDLMRRIHKRPDSSIRMMPRPLRAHIL